MEFEQTKPASWLDRPVFSSLPDFKIETVLVAIVIILAILSRFVNLGVRSMDHDEVNHVVPAYSLFTGQGYAYDPVTHGPLQFHMMALSFFLLGDSDFSTRAPDAAVSVITVLVVLFLFRRYLGRVGALIAGFLYVISPYMMFYGRYTRNEVYGGLWTVLIIYGVLRYLEKGDKLTLYLLTVVMALHFTDKATGYIYNAEMLIFLGLLFLMRMIRISWPSNASRRTFLILMAAGLVLMVGVVAFGALTANNGTPPPQPDLGRIFEIVVVVMALAAFLAAFISLVRNLGWKVIRAQRTFDLIVLVGSLTLPLLAAFPVRMLGWDPLDYSTGGIFRSAFFLVPMFLVAVAIGLWWKPRFWIRASAIFWAIFTVFFTTFFTNGKGFFMGLVASLGYWLSQQGVVRGGQPLYYYALIQIPIYEYLAALGAILALILALRHGLFSQFGGHAPAAQPEFIPPEEQPQDDDPGFVFSLSRLFGKQPEPAPITLEDESDLQEIPVEAVPADAGAGAAAIITPVAAEVTAPEQVVVENPSAPKIPVAALLLYWSLTSLVAYSLAGERMPWLTVHIAGAMLLASGWALGFLVDTTPWKKIANRKGLVTILLIPVILTSLAGVFGSLLGANPPFQGNTVPQLESSSTFAVSLIALILSVYGFLRILKEWETHHLSRLLVLGFFCVLAVLTARTAYTASFINYDYANEFLVYAHGTPGPKEALAQIEEISRRITKGKDLVVAYDNETNYPWWWYLRDWPNKKYFGDTPGRDIRDAAIITVGDPNYAKVEPIVKNDYIMYEYMRLWWPMQDYFNLTFDRVWSAITNPKMRQALFNIWFNRDYTLYAQVTGEKTLTLTTWQPSARFRIYIRKDIVAQMWNYGAAPATTTPIQTDPYEASLIPLLPDAASVTSASPQSQLNGPRGLAVAPDGTVYVADTGNNRIVHYSADLTQVINSWGTFADVLKGPAPAGTFNQPWGVVVAKDGSVFVADTFNFRIQKFSADGTFIKMWGYFGQAEKPEAFWGPRGLAFDRQGRLFVTDTGNKRVVIFDAEGNGITSFGTAGFAQGQLDEPVGIAIDKEGIVYVADTWNQRIQAFSPDPSNQTYLPIRMWDVSAWFGQSLDNKPYISVDSASNVYITDPEGGRVLEFGSDGKFLRGISVSSEGAGNFKMPAGVAIDSSDHVFVTDATGNRVMRFTLPALPAQPAAPPAAQGSPQQSASPQASPTSGQ